MTAHLILTLEAPLIAFGGETIDNRGVVRNFPARSMLTGLIANALGWDRTEGARLDALQARINFAAVRLREGARRQDYQTARLFEGDAGWTTHGAPEGRSKSPSFSWDRDWETARGTSAKSLTHQRFRDFDADALVLVALALTEGGDPDLSTVAAALARPERPLFVGRKPCLPSGPICGAASVEAAFPIDALLRHLVEVGWHGAAPAAWQPVETDTPGAARMVGEPPSSGRLTIQRQDRVSDERRHRTGVHGGSRAVAEGILTVEPHA